MSSPKVGPREFHAGNRVSLAPYKRGISDGTPFLDSWRNPYLVRGVPREQAEMSRPLNEVSFSWRCLFIWQKVFIFKVFFFFYMSFLTEHSSCFFCFTTLPALPLHGHKKRCRGKALEQPHRPCMKHTAAVLPTPIASGTVPCWYKNGCRRAQRRSLAKCFFFRAVILDNAKQRHHTRKKTERRKQTHTHR